jgi:hypothetical protein
VADLERDGGTWVEYRFANPATGQEERKISWLYLYLNPATGQEDRKDGYVFGSGATWLYLYDGYVFGAGYYIDPATAVQRVVGGTIDAYQSEGVGGAGPGGGR